MAPKYVIGLVGVGGSGKATFSKILRELLQNWAPGLTLDVAQTGSEGFLRHCADDLGMERTTQNYDLIATMLKHRVGDDAIARGMKNTIDRSLCNIVVYDAIRWQADLDVVHGYEHRAVVYIFADLESAYAHLKRRNREEERGMTFDEFRRQQGDETRRDILALSEHADFTIDNTRTEAELRTQVQHFFESHVLPVFSRAGQPSASLP